MEHVNPPPPAAAAPLRCSLPRRPQGYDQVQSPLTRHPGKHCPCSPPCGRKAAVAALDGILRELPAASGELTAACCCNFNRPSQSLSLQATSRKCSRIMLLAQLTPSCGRREPTHCCSCCRCCVTCNQLWYYHRSCCLDYLFSVSAIVSLASEPRNLNNLISKKTLVHEADPDLSSILQVLHSALCSHLKDCSETSRDLTMKCLAQLAG